MKRKALGKGLSALLPDPEPAATASGSAAELPIGEIEPNPEQPRTLIDAARLAELAASIQESGIEVALPDGMPGFIRKSELSRDRSEQRPDRFAVGERVDAKITTVDRATRRVSLSIKAREVDEEKRAMQEFGSAESSASLGDILGAAIRRRQGETDEKTDDKE